MRFFITLITLHIHSAVFLSNLCDAFSGVIAKRSGSSLHLLTSTRHGCDLAHASSRVETSLHFSTPSENDGARHTYVEGEHYDDRLAEIEAMGGDPFFMDEEDENDESLQSSESQEVPMIPGNSLLNSLISKASTQSVTDGNGPSRRGSNKITETSDPNWEWDGTVDEDAHLDLD